MKEKFNLATWSIGYEVPFFDIQAATGVEALSQGISSKYYNWFDCLALDFRLVKLPSENYMILFTIVVRIDNELVNIESWKSDWESMKTGISEVIKDFLNSNKVNEYRVIVQSNEL